MAENGWSQFGQAKVWQTLAYTLSGGANGAHQELDIIWTSDNPTGQLNKLESSEVASDSAFPQQYTVTHPTISGATKATIIVPTKVYADGYTIKLYAHANGKIYLIEGNLQQGTTIQAEGLKKIIQSFTITTQ